MPTTSPSLAGLPTPLHVRNSLLDRVFYNLGALTDAERAMLEATDRPEGSVMLVSPGSGLELLGRVDDVVGNDDAARVVAVSGVGSSDIGAAAFARDVANGLGRPALAVVAGQGTADVIAEALGGWFFYGAANQITLALNTWQETLERLREVRTAREMSMETTIAAAPAPEPERDDLALYRLLASETPIDTLVGHSKGCLSIAFALNRLKDEDPDAFARRVDTRVVTFGTVVALPSEMRKEHQFLGGFDWLGAMNSRPFLMFEPVPWAWHHLNDGRFLSMNVSEQLAKLPR